MALSRSMESDDMALHEGLYALYQDISSTISFNFDYPASEDDLRIAAANLLTYLVQFTNRNKRRVRTALVAANLMFSVLRTRNPAEEAVREDGKRIKGDKEWYCLVLSESEGGIGGGGHVQIIGEGMLKKDKAELLDGFWEMVERQNAEWERQDGITQKGRLEGVKHKQHNEKEMAIAKTEIEAMEDGNCRKSDEGGIGREYNSM